MTLEAKSPPEPIYRIGRRPNAWQPPDWSQASKNGTFDNRFDDPESYYGVIYASSQEVSCISAGAKIDRITPRERGDAAEEN